MLFSSCKRNENFDTKTSVVFGLDVSQYQGNINWKKVATQKKHPIQFVVVRATMGADRRDKQFEKNFFQAKKNGFLVGSYHYYDPNENSTLQAKNFLDNVRLQTGDLIPVLDIEEESEIQSMEDLKKGIKNWLDIIEEKYGVKPIIYTGFSFWNDYLKKDFAEYPLWVAAYSQDKRNHSHVKNAEIHQFSDKIKVPGIMENTVDGNDIKKEVLPSLILR